MKKLQFLACVTTLFMISACGKDEGSNADGDSMQPQELSALQEAFIDEY